MVVFIHALPNVHNVCTVYVMYSVHVDVRLLHTCAMTHPQGVFKLKSLLFLFKVLTMQELVGWSTLSALRY